MKKKVIGISILLLVLLLGLSTTTYADTYRVWTLSDLKNVLINSLQTKTTFNIETAREKLDLQTTNLETVLNDLNSYGYNYISWRNSGYDVDFQFFDTSNLTYAHPYLSSNALVFLHTPSGKFTNITYNGGDWYFSFQTNINNATSFSHVNNIYYSGSSVYQNYNTNSSIIRNGGDYSPSTLFEENYYSNARFDITLNTNNNTEYVYINTDTGNEIIHIPIIYNNNFGYLTDTTYIYYIDDLLGFWYFDGNTWKYKLIYNNSSEGVLLKSNNYMSFVYDSANNNEICDLILKDIYTYNNVVYHFSVTNAQLDSASCYFIIGDNNTVVSSGTLIVSGDYFENGNYNNQFNGLDSQVNDNNNTSNIIDSINNGNNNIIAALTSTNFSGDIGSGDFINYNVVDPTANFFDFLLGGISTIFLNNEEIYLPIDIPYISNETYYLSSDFFIVTGPLLLLFNFLWVYFVIIPKINEVHELVKTINMGYTDVFISYFGYGISINDLL